MNGQWCAILTENDHAKKSCCLISVPLQENSGTLEWAFRILLPASHAVSAAAAELAAKQQPPANLCRLHCHVGWPNNVDALRHGPNFPFRRLASR
jgi:hypothetical protein